MLIRKLRIGPRLVLGFGLILCMSALMLAGTIIGLERSRLAYVEASNQSQERHALAVDMRQALMASSVAVRNMGLRSEMDAVNQAAAAAKEQWSAYQRAKHDLERLLLGEDEKAIFATLVSIDESMQSNFKEALGMAMQFNTEQAAKIITEKIEPLSVKANDAIARFIEVQKARASAANTTATDATLRVQRAASAVGVSIILASAFIAWRLGMSITRPLRQAVAAASLVARGDLSAKITVTGQDEAADLLASLRDMQDSLASMVNGVLTGARNISHASSEIARGNADLSTRTESQASNLQQTAASTEEMASTLVHSAANAKVADELAAEATTVAQQGSAAVERVVDVMAEISSSSSKISDITSVIDGIAFQTNILALNAAVEAARAGEHGRGFAVVASEVRVLAQRCSQAAREIKNLIANSAEGVESGTRTVQDARVTLEQVVSRVQRFAELVGEITTATKEQSSGIGQINLSVSQLDQMTQQNAALVEQSAAATEGLAQQASQLTAAVSAFRLAGA